MLIRTEPVGLGYLQVDNRAAGQRMVEADTYTCTHCQRVVVMNPDRKRPRYKCRGCNHLICDGCAAIREAGAPCKTFAQLVDETLEQAERQAGSSPLVLP